MTFEGWIQEAAEHLIKLRGAHPRTETWCLVTGNGPGPLFGAYHDARERALAAEGLTPMVIDGEHTHGPLREQSRVDRDIALCAFELALRGKAVAS